MSQHSNSTSNSPANGKISVNPATRLALPWLIPMALLLGCQAQHGTLATTDEFRLTKLETPTGPGAIAPSLTSTRSGLVLTWLEPALDPPDENRSTEHPPVPHQGQKADASDAGEQKSPRPKTWELRTSVLRSNDGQGPSPPRVIVRGDDFFANWADFPSVAEHPSGSLVTHHLAKLGLGTYAYGAHLSSTSQAGESWTSSGLLHDDSSLTEHGFVSYARDGDQLRAFWLDGREMAVDGPMTLRTTTIEASSPTIETSQDRATGPALQPQPSSLLDDRVCECCSTDAATAGAGPVVVYRNRTEKEIRDIYLIRKDEDEWSEPVLVHKDGWKIEGCPVNGPAVVAKGDFVAVAWFTAANAEPKVQLAVSYDGGRKFGRPMIIQEGNSQGRVDLLLSSRDTERGAAEGSEASSIDLWVAHLGKPRASAISTSTSTEEGAGEHGASAILLDHVVAADKQLLRSNTFVVASSSEARASGFPRLAHHQGSLFVAWVAPEEPSRVHLAQFSRESVELTLSR